MTWGEFKQCVEEKGVKDEDELWYIDVNPVGELAIHVVRDEDLGIKIT